MKSCLVRGLQQIEAIYEELKNTSTAVPDQNVRLGIDRLKTDKDLLVAAALLKMTNDNISQHSSNTRSTQASKHSLRSSQRLRRSGSTTTSSKAREAEADVAAHRAEREAARKEEELNNLELEETKRRAEADAAMQRTRRALDQQRIEKLLRMEEAKVSSALAETFTASMSLIRLPAPEPTIFDGDPLKYND